MTSSLPSFNDFVSSLGLSKQTDLPFGLPACSARIGHSRNSSASSSSFPHFHSRTSSFSSSEEDDSVSSISPVIHVHPDPDSSPIIPNPPHSPRSEKSQCGSRLRGARYSPYGSEKGHSRRPSLPSMLGDLSLIPDSDSRSHSASPRTQNFSPIVEQPPSPPPPTTNRNIKRLELALDLSLPGSPPISSFARRRTPNSSPSSPSSTYDANQHLTPSGSLLPLVLPTVPAVGLPIFPSTVDDAADGVASPTRKLQTHRRTRSKQTGLRISAWQYEAAESQARS